MTPHIAALLYDLERAFNLRLDAIHDQALAKFRTLARSTGQRTRIDRLKGEFKSQR